MSGAACFLTLVFFPGGDRGGRSGTEAADSAGREAATVIEAGAVTVVGGASTTEGRGGDRVFFFFFPAVFSKDDRG